MSTLIFLSPREDLVARVVSLLKPEGNDFSRTAVIFPGKRPAHFVRKAIADRVQSAFLPPELYSIDTFIECIHKDLLGIRRRNLEASDAIALLYEIHREVDTRIGGGNFVSLDVFVPVALQLFSELEEIHLARVPVRRIREVLGSIEYPKFRALGHYYERFYEEIAHRGYATRSTRYCAVADQIDQVDFGGFEQLILGGFYAFTAAESIIFKNLLKRDIATMVFQNGIGLGRQLADLDIVPPDPEQGDVPRVTFHPAPDTHGQVFALAARLRHQLEEGERFDHGTAIVLPAADALFPAVHHALTIVPGENYNIALGYPLSRTPAYAFLSTLMELVGSMDRGRFSSEKYLKYLLHPYTKNVKLGNRSDVTRILFHTLEDQLAEQRTGMLFTLDELENDDILFQEAVRRLAGTSDDVTDAQLRDHLVAIHENTIRKLITMESLGDFARRLIEILTYIFEQSTASRHPLFHPYVERLIGVLETIRSSLLAKHSFTSVDGYFSFLRGILEVESVPFSGTPLKGLQVLGLLETRNLRFETLYILDASDDVLPGTPREDLLLRQSVREMLGLETYRDRERLIEYYFDLALHGAKDVHLFYTESGKKNRSRYVEKLLWRKQQVDRVVSSRQYEHAVRYRVRLVNERPEPISKSSEDLARMQRHLRFTATALDTYLDCGLKFYYQNVLRIHERTEASDSLDQMDVGTIVHSILARYLQPALGKPLSADLLSTARLEEVLDEIFREEFGADLTGPIRLLRQQVALQLTQFLQKYQIPIIEREQVVLLGLEERIEIEQRGYRFAGRLDRTEARGEGGFIHILDYKTGHDDSKLRIRRDKLVSDEPSTWHPAIQSFQLPIYMLLYAGRTKKPLNKLIPSFLFLGRQRIDEHVEVGLSDDSSSPKDIYDSVEPIIFQLIDQILDQNTPFLPTADLEGQCPRCPYMAICGTQWVRGWTRD